MPRERFSFRRKGVSSSSLGQLWDAIALTDLENVVLRSLQVINPDLERLSFVGTQRARSAVVRVTGTANPVPLRSLGDGISRMLGIVLSLVSARDGLLLIDEVENGI